MVYRLADGSTGSLDYREMAPSAAHRDMFLDSLGNHDTAKSTLGGGSIAVPGTIKGIVEAHKKFGLLSIEALINPVIELAENGYVVTQKQSERLAQYRDIIAQTTFLFHIFHSNFYLFCTFYTCTVFRSFLRGI